MQQQEDELMNPRQVAEYLGMSQAYLEKMRREGGGLPFVRLSRRAVRYKRGDLDKFIEERTRTSTAG